MLSYPQTSQRLPSASSSPCRNHQRIDVLVNNAGMSYRGSALDTDVSVDIRLMVVNYFGQIALTKGQEWAIRICEIC